MDGQGTPQLLIAHGDHEQIVVAASLPRMHRVGLLLQLQMYEFRISGWPWMLCKHLIDQPACGSEEVLIEPP
jgi:hypothetical protein